MTKYKSIFSFFIILFCSISIYGQNQENNIQIKRVDKNYTWETATQEKIDSFYFDLTPVCNSNMQKHIRFSTEGTIIDLFTNDNQIYEGFVIKYIYDYVYNKKTDNSERKHIIFEKIPLGNEKVKWVMDTLIAKQFEIPTDTLILNWNKRFFDGYGIKFTFKINDQFKTQYYNNPESQNDSVDYKHIIIDNDNFITTTFRIDTISRTFSNKLPKGKMYSLGAMGIYIMTEKQIKKREEGKPIRNYLKSVRDTINNYIKTELAKQKIELKDIDCFDDYLIVFGKNGKLKKVTIYHKPKRKDYDLSGFLEEKREIRKCKSEIAKIFKKMNLSFIEPIKPKYNIYRKFSFNYDGKYQFYDNVHYYDD